MTDKLDTLLQIASAAQVRDEYWSENQALFDRTFENPRLIEKLLAEVIAGRELRSYPSNRMPTNEEIGEGYRARGRYDKAREALDAECAGEGIGGL